MECNFENCPNFERLGKKFADKISELEQENERLKEEVRTEKIYSSQIEELEESLNHLKQENERLKERNEELTSDNPNTIQEMDNERRRVEQLKEEITELEEKFLTLNGKSYSYYLTLQEIKGIATALYMNEWLQQNETARQSIRLLQEVLTKAEEE